MECIISGSASPTLAINTVTNKVISFFQHFKIYLVYFYIGNGVVYGEVYIFVGENWKVLTEILCSNLNF